MLLNVAERGCAGTHTSRIPIQKIDMTLFCINVIVFTPRLLLENDRYKFNLLGMFGVSDNDLPINERINNYYYLQLFGGTNDPN